MSGTWNFKWASLWSKKVWNVITESLYGCWCHLFKICVLLTDADLHWPLCANWLYRCTVYLNTWAVISSSRAVFSCLWPIGPVEFDTVLSCIVRTMKVITLNDWTVNKKLLGHDMWLITTILCQEQFYFRSVWCCLMYLDLFCRVTFAISNVAFFTPTMR